MHVFINYNQAMGGGGVVVFNMYNIKLKKKTTTKKPSSHINGSPHSSHTKKFLSTFSSKKKTSNISSTVLGQGLKACIYSGDGSWL